MELDPDLIQDLYLNQSYEDYLNGSWEGPCVQPQNSNLLPYVYSVICVLGLLGNTLVVLTYCCSRGTANITQVLLFNLALADLVLVLVLPGLVVSEVRGWEFPAGVTVCKILRGGYSVSLYSATLLLACVSADRYAAVVHARRRLRKRSQTLVYVCVCVWICSCVLSMPTFIFYEVYSPEHSTVLTLDHNKVDAPPGSLTCSLRFPTHSLARALKVVLPVTQFLVGFLVPMLLMFFCYGSILWTLLRKHSLRRHRAVRLVLLVALVFVVCHLPYNLVLVWSTALLFRTKSCENWNRLEYALNLLQTLAYLHCVLNPLLYSFNSATYRAHFYKTVQVICCKLRLQRRLSSTSQSERSTVYTM